VLSLTAQFGPPAGGIGGVCGWFMIVNTIGGVVAGGSHAQRFLDRRRIT